MDSYFIINRETGLTAENQGIFGTQDSFHSTGPNITVGDSVETPKIKNTNTPPLNEVHVEDFTARLVAMKGFFMNEIFGLKMEIKSLKEKLQNSRNISPNSNDDNIKNLELRISFLKLEHSFIETESQNMQEIINKILETNCFQSKDECCINCSNENDKKVAGTPNHVNGKPLIGNKIIASDRRNQNPGKSQQTIAENKNTNHDGKTPVSENDFSTGRKKIKIGWGLKDKIC